MKKPKLLKIIGLAIIFAGLVIVLIIRRRGNAVSVISDIFNGGGAAPGNRAGAADRIDSDISRIQGSNDTIGAGLDGAASGAGHIESGIAKLNSANAKLEALIQDLQNGHG